MTKKQLGDALASAATHLSREDARVLVDTLFAAMSEVLQGGGRIEIRGFGSLHTKWRAARTVVHPKDGSRRLVAAKQVARFVAYKAWRRRLGGTGTTAVGPRL